MLFVLICTVNVRAVHRARLPIVVELNTAHADDDDDDDDDDDGGDGGGDSSNGAAANALGNAVNAAGQSAGLSPDQAGQVSQQAHDAAQQALDNDEGTIAAAWDAGYAAIDALDQLGVTSPAVSVAIGQAIVAWGSGS
jgi:hypothetical protein